MEKSALDPEVDLDQNTWSGHKPLLGLHGESRENPSRAGVEAFVGLRAKPALGLHLPRPVKNIFCRHTVIGPQYGFSAYLWNHQFHPIFGGTSCRGRTMMRRFWIRLVRLLRFGYLKVMRIKAPPHSLALGMALGVFVGCLPVIPFQTVIALALAYIFRCNKIAAALGTWVSNPANVVFVYYFLYQVGRFFVPGVQNCFDPEHLALAEMLQSGWHLVMVMSVGGVIVGIPAAVLTYCVTVRVVLLYHARRAERRLRRRSLPK